MAASAACSGATSIPDFFFALTDARFTIRGRQARVGWFRQRLIWNTQTPLRWPSRSQKSPSAHDTPFGVLPVGKPTPSADICIMQSVRGLPPPGTRVAAATRSGPAASRTATAADFSSAPGTTELLTGSQPLHVGGDVGVAQLLQHGPVLRVRLDRGGDVGIRHPGHLRIAGERGHVQGLAGRRVGVAGRAVTAGAVLLEERRAVSGQGGAGGEEEE